MQLSEKQEFWEGHEQALIATVWKDYKQTLGHEQRRFWSR